MNLSKELVYSEMVNSTADLLPLLEVMEEEAHLLIW
jgi:hypothetical protein